MFRWMCVVAVYIATVYTLANAADEVYDSPKSAQANPDFLLQGEYASQNLGLQVVALGNGQFTTVKYPGGLPGAGWTGDGKQVIEEEDEESTRELLKSLQVERVDRLSSTIDEPAPDGAIVLFDGTEASVKSHWQPGAMSTEGLLHQGCTSLDRFQDCTVHVEFRIPFMPAARGQERGNSGIYYQGRFETQMLDSFGLDGKDNETGGIYSIKSPDLNMCLPPLTWQTYDAEFTAARYEGDKKVAHARLTVRLNGVVVQSDIELPQITTAAPYTESPEPGPIYLQDHGAPVRYRNIWVLPRNAEREARRPIVPGFERFHALASGDPVEGGHLLMGELGCTACHARDQQDILGVSPRQAPILSEVGRRVRPEWISQFLSDPQSTKPGSTMPHVLAGWSESERAPIVAALTHFLASTGTPAKRRGDRGAAQRGQELFHTVGCTVCHAPRDGSPAPPRSTTIPLGAIAQKYTITTLSEFIKSPHAFRPSGRMPAMPLNDQQFIDIANYLVGEDAGPPEGRPKTPNMSFRAYQGDWSELPPFDRLTPSAVGESRGLDLSVVGQTNLFGVVFEGVLHLERSGDYRLRIGSDDGSAIYIDGKKVADADGIHPHHFGEGRANLKAGAHPVRIEYFQGGGEWTLECQIEGPGISMQSIDQFITQSADIQPVFEQPAAGFVVDDALIARGRDLFQTLGCAACHEMQVGEQRLVSPAAKPLTEVNPSRGCLATSPPVRPDSRAPDYALSPQQQRAIRSALQAAIPESTPESIVRQTMTAFNCRACHVRQRVGGPESTRNQYFKTTIPEMGDEGRLPPPLDGVGDKLTRETLSHVLSHGADDRPYMRVAMPAFGEGRLAKLHESLIQLDEQTLLPMVSFSEPESRVKSTGRHLAGDQGLACIKCHTFGENRATGIQAIDMQKMSRRLREDWFRRYLFNPQAYRPGTRMPTGFPNGQAVVRDVYEGEPSMQIAALWTYLKDGERAGIPAGLLAEMIELQPTNHPIIYRNFLDGLSPRGIAVGYPEHCNIGWDANQMSLGLVWHGRFIDASKHWVGRGSGLQAPLGDHITRIEETSPVAILDSADKPWPVQPPKERGYKFLGYELDENARPSFRYRAGIVTVADFPEPVGHGAEGSFRRHLTLHAEQPVDNVYLRVATGSTIESHPDGTYTVDRLWTVSISGGGVPFLRDSNGRRELLVPIQVNSTPTEVVFDIHW